MDYSSLDDFLSEAKLKYNLKQHQIYNQLAVDASTWYRKRKNLETITVKDILKISELTKTDPSELFKIILKQPKK